MGGINQVEQVCMETLIGINSCLGPCVVEIRSKDPKRVGTVMRLALGQMLVTMRRVAHAMVEDSARGSRAKS